MQDNRITLTPFQVFVLAYLTTEDMVRQRQISCKDS